MSQYSCGYCNEMGHNKAGCPERKKSVADIEAMRIDRMNQMLARFEIIAAKCESLEKEVDLIWTEIHNLDIEATMGNRDIEPDPPKKSGKPTVIFDF